jgi:hypothetical protein
MSPSNSDQQAHYALHRNFWWLWSSLFATVVSLLVLQSVALSVPCVMSSGWALQRLLQSQVMVLDSNDMDLEMQPLEQAGLVPQRRNLTLYQAFQRAVSTYMYERS